MRNPPPRIRMLSDSEERTHRGVFRAPARPSASAGSSAAAHHLRLTEAPPWLGGRLYRNSPWQFQQKHRETETVQQLERAGTMTAYNHVQRSGSVYRYLTDCSYTYFLLVVYVNIDCSSMNVAVALSLSWNIFFNIKYNFKCRCEHSHSSSSSMCSVRTLDCCKGPLPWFL